MTDEQILEKELIGTRKPHINHFYNDGGRSKYFKGEKVGDCVVRAIAVAANLDYKEVYDELWKRNKQYLKRNGKEVIFETVQVAERIEHSTEYFMSGYTGDKLTHTAIGSFAIGSDDFEEISYIEKVEG